MIVRAAAICWTFLIICGTQPGFAQNDTASVDISVTRLSCPSSNPMCNSAHDASTSPSATVSKGLTTSVSLGTTTSWKTVTASGETSPGTFKALANLARKAYPGASQPSPQDDSINGPNILVTVKRVTHFTANSLLPILYPLTMELQGTIVPNINTSNGIAVAGLNIQVHQNKKGSPVDLTVTTPCNGSSPTSPANCVSQSYNMSHYGDTYQTGSTPEDITLANKDAVYYTDIVALANYELTIVATFGLNVSMPPGTGPVNVKLDFTGTGHFFIDSPDPSNPLIADDGHDYSDPARRKAVLAVESKTPAVGAGGGVSAEPKNKMLGGGVALPNGTSRRLVTSRPVSSAHPNPAPPSWSPGWLAGDFDPSSSGKTAVTVYGLELLDAEDPVSPSRYRVTVTEQNGLGGFRSRPFARASVPSGFTLASGGCRLSEPTLHVVRTGTAGRQPTMFLTGSYPFVDASGTQMWICEAQSQRLYPSGLITAYAVGVQDTASSVPIPMSILKVISPMASRPTASAMAAAGLVISGCGGRVETSSSPVYFAIDHQFLTATYPLTPTTAPKGPATGCQASASDYGASAPGIVDAYAVNLYLDRPLLTAVSPSPVQVGHDLSLTGLHFPTGMMEVQFDDGTAPPTTAQTISGSNPRFAIVKVPASLPPGTYNVGIVHAGLTGLVSQPLSVTVTP